MRYMGMADKVKAVLSLLLLTGCTSLPAKKAHLPPQSAVVESLPLENKPGFPDKNQNLKKGLYTESVLLFYRDSMTGEWESHTIKVELISDFKATICFKITPHLSMADCFYVDKDGEVMFENVKIIGEEDT